MRACAPLVGTDAFPARGHTCTRQSGCETSTSAQTEKRCLQGTRRRPHHRRRVAGAWIGGLGTAMPLAGSALDSFSLVAEKTGAAKSPGGTRVSARQAGSVPGA